MSSLKASTPQNPQTFPRDCRPKKKSPAVRRARPTAALSRRSKRRTRHKEFRRLTGVGLKGNNFTMKNPRFLIKAFYHEKPLWFRVTCPVHPVFSPSLPPWSAMPGALSLGPGAQFGHPGWCVPNLPPLQPEYHQLSWIPFGKLRKSHGKIHLNLKRYIFTVSSKVFFSGYVKLREGKYIHHLLSSIIVYHHQCTIAIYYPCFFCGTTPKWRTPVNDPHHIPTVARKLIFQPALNGRVYVDWRDHSQQNYQSRAPDESQL